MGSYAKSLGTFLAGALFNTFLYGLVTYQFAVYHRAKFDDRTRTKYMVLSLFILDTFHSILVLYTVWYYVVTNFTNLAAFEMPMWAYALTPLMTALAALATQIYLGFSIWCLTKNKILYSVTIVLAISSFCMGASCTMIGLIVKERSEYQLLMSLPLTWMILQVAVDTYNTTMLIVLYVKLRTGFRKTDTMLNQLIRGATQTGLFVGVFSIVDLVCVLNFPDTALYATFCIPLGRIYTNTLLDNLLTRESIKADMDDPVVKPSDIRLTTQIVIYDLE